ncbi:uncharacterized protein LOC122403667 [Colletes gigas]|uniref:uncharacterized protein LOC122403667 n=1 Tax=Colletes gigas TaxID=935657 RepID=UPI001C9BA135|nr:uncharacterized protein LOC122403667 [Colletes gigas]
MSDTTFFAKPKVRFCQTDASKLKTERLKSSTDQKDTVQSNKPKIRSIVTLKKPVILMKSKKPSSDQENNFKSTDNARKTELSMLDNNACSPRMDQSTSCSTDTPVKTETMKPLSDANNIQIVKVNSKDPDKTKVSNKISSIIISPASPVAQDENSNKLKTHVKTHITKKDCVNSKRGKENDALVAKKDIKNKVPSIIISSASSVAQDENSDKLKTHVKAHITKKDCINSKRGKENDALAAKKDIKNKIPSIIISSAPPVAQDENSNKLKTHVKAHITKKDCVKSKGKENDALVAKKDTKNTFCKTKSCPAVPNKKNSTNSKLNTKSTATNVMPCHKYNKVSSRIKICAVKKTVVRDINGPKIKPDIGPGIQHKKQIDIKTAETNENAQTKPCTSGEKLARPEYNSIMCTINKLKEMKKQKFVTDIEHLPATYKNLINGKISSALDFPLEEVVYKNLVDLSVDDKQLPSRLTRSKDPEPRQRDTVPILSDFFTPESTEEYCTPISTKPRTPETIDNWSAFRVSDKIFEWKDILDHV